jgi:hypothetical protein
MTDEHVISQNGWARQIARAIMRATDRMTNAIDGTTLLQ